MTAVRHRIPVGDAVLGSLLYENKKSDALPMIFVNGGPGGSYQDEHHPMAPFAEDRTLILYDQRCCFHSPAPLDDRMIHMPRFVDEVAAVMDYYGLEHAIVTGHSFGASVALDFALAFPKRVAALILSSPLISTRRWLEDTNILLSAMPEEIQGVIRDGLEGKNIDDVAYKAAEDAFYKKHLCRLDPWPERLIKGSQYDNTAPYETTWGRSEFVCTGTLKTYERFDDLEKLAMPVLFACGRHDEVRVSTLEEAAAKAVCGEIHIFEESAHMPYYEQPEEFLKILGDFAARVDADAKV